MIIAYIVGIISTCVIGISLILSSVTMGTSFVSNVICHPVKEYCDIVLNLKSRVNNLSSSNKQRKISPIQMQEKTLDLENPIPQKVKCPYQLLIRISRKNTLEIAIKPRVNIHEKIWKYYLKELRRRIMLIHSCYAPISFHILAIKSSFFSS